MLPPEQSDLNVLIKFKGDVQGLCKEEQFLKAVLDVPRLKPRLTCIKFKLQ